MELKVYINISEKNKLDKTLNNETTYTGQLKNETSIINPVIMVEGSLQNLAAYNYAYIPSFLRYYFLTDILSIRNNLIELHLSVDVLMSFKTQILNQSAIIKRQKNVYNLYLDDENFKTYNYSHTVTKQFPKGFPSLPSFILTTVGGGNL